MQQALLFFGLLVGCGAFQSPRGVTKPSRNVKVEKMRTLDRVTIHEENYDHSVGNDVWLDLFVGSNSREEQRENKLSGLSEAVVLTEEPTMSTSDLKSGLIDVHKLISSRTFKRDGETSSSFEGSSNVRSSDFNHFLESFQEKMPESDNSEFRPSWTPDLGAWRVAVPEVGDAGAEQRRPDLVHPPLLQEYLYGEKRKLGEFHEEKVQELWKSVQKGSLRDLADADAEAVVESLRVAYTGLWGKTTLRSLDVSINRARGIAAVLGELKADVDVVMAGVLHEVIAEFRYDDNFAALRAQLVSRFGEVAIDLAEAYGRLPKLMAKREAYSPAQSEDQVQMLVAFVEDYRCLYIRLADRVSTLRALKRLPLTEEAKSKIATESLNVYAPLAHKMGVMKVKGELEDLAFKVLNPEAFQQTRYTQTAANKAYHEVAEQIQELIQSDPYLRSQNGAFKLTYRIKDKYQLMLKMKRKGFKSLHDVKDALGLRVIIDYPRRKGESESAYLARGDEICYYLIERLKVMPGWEPDAPLKDYIAGMKDNGYQSLHLYIRNMAVGTHVETQVRTLAMHKTAEMGEAAHWYYKDQIYRPEVASTTGYKKAWRSVKQLEAATPAALIGMAKAQLLKSRVFVILADKATVLNLKRGATALDAAFAIHSSLGLQTSVVMINGKKSRLDRILRNGDIISVVRSSDGQPTATHDWSAMVRTDAARRVLRLHFTKETRVALVCSGLIYLMMMLSLNAERVKIRNFGTMPDASQLNRFASQRFDGQHIGEVLVTLGKTQSQGMRRVVGQLLDIPEEDLTTTSLAWSLKWIRMQCRHGWVNHKLRTNTLMPLIKQVLPSLGFDNSRLQRKWTSLVGPLAFAEGTYSPYTSSLAKAFAVKPPGPRLCPTSAVKEEISTSAEEGQ